MFSESETQFLLSQKSQYPTSNISNPDKQLKNVKGRKIFSVYLIPYFTKKETGPKRPTNLLKVTQTKTKTKSPLQISLNLTTLFLLS